MVDFEVNPPIRSPPSQCTDPTIKCNAKKYPKKIYPKNRTFFLIYDAETPFIPEKKAKKLCAEPCRRKYMHFLTLYLLEVMSECVKNLEHFWILILIEIFSDCAPFFSPRKYDVRGYSTSLLLFSDAL